MKNHNIINNSRIEWVDNIKSFACLLVALCHLLQSLFIITPNYLKKYILFINYYVYLFHMPIFLCVSGFLYDKGKRIKNFNEYKKFEIKKIVNLFIPYFTFYSLTIILNVFFSNNVNTPLGLKDWIGIFNSPIPPYWFIYALLSIFIIIPIIEKKIKDKKKVLLLFIILKIFSISFCTKIYFIDSIMRYGIYFCLGIMIDTIKKTYHNIFLYLVNVLLIFIVLFVYKILNNTSFIYEIVSILLGLIIMMTIILIFKNWNSNKMFNSYKKYTFQIFLLHTICAAGTRILLYKIGINNYYVHFIIGLVASIYLPVLVSVISNKLQFTNFFFFPLKTIEEYKKGR